MKERAAKGDLGQVPAEIKDHIASHLNKQDLFSLLLTCRRLWTAMEPELWRAVCIKDSEACRSIRETIQSRPSLAEAVTQLELRVAPDKANDRQDDGIYSDLALAASLPNLKYLAVRTACREYDPKRSREAIQALLKLHNLESCDLYWDHDNAENWVLDNLTACFSLTYHLSVQRVCLRGFDSRGGVTPPPGIVDELLDRKREIPLQKLSLLNCDFHPRHLAELLDNCAPLELEFLFWHSGQYPPISTGVADPDEYITAIQKVAQTSLERLTFYRDHERDEDVPLRFEKLTGLKFLSTNILTLCGGDPAEFDSNEEDEPPEPSNGDSPMGISLPPELEMLDILFFEGLEPTQWTAEVEPFLEKLEAQQGRSRSKIQGLQFRTCSGTNISGSELQKLKDFGARCGLAVTVSHLPEDWEDGPNWVGINGF